MIVTAKHKYATIGFIYLLGLICASFIDVRLCLGIFAVLAPVCIFALKGKGQLRLYMAVISVAFLVSGLYGLIFIEPCYKLAGKTAFVTGTVTEALSPDNDTVLLSISGAADGVPVRFTLFAADTGITPGDKVELTAMFSRLTDTGYFAEESYYYSKGVFLKAYARGEIAVTEGTGNIFTHISDLSNYFRERTESFLTGGEAALVKAMLFGDKSGLTVEQYVNIRRSGVSHLTAVSGMHLSLIVHLAAPFIRFIFKKRRILEALAFMTFIGVLMIFFGLTASVLRSGIMMIIYYGSYFPRRRAQTLSSVGGALLFILIVSPCACRDIGLWLSVLGTIGVGAVSPIVCRRLKGKNYLSETVVTSLCAALCTAPVGMFCFGGISLAAVPAGILLQPFFTVIIALVPVGVMVPFLSEPLLFIAGAASAAMDFIISLFGSADFVYIEVSSSTIGTFIAVTVVFTLAAAAVSGRRSTVVRLLVMSLAAFCGALSLAEIIEGDNIRLSVYSDGTGAVLMAENRKGVSFYVLEYTEKTSDIIIQHAAGKSTELICIAEELSDNLIPSEKCTVHLPEQGSMRYDISGEYSVTVNSGEIILDIRGVTVGLLPIESETLCDAAVYVGYDENFKGRGNSATILCDKRFYNCDNAVNACYEKAELIINSGGMLARETD